MDISEVLHSTGLSRNYILQVIISIGISQVLSRFFYYKQTKLSLPPPKKEGTNVFVKG